MVKGRYKEVLKPTVAQLTAIKNMSPYIYFSFKKPKTFEEASELIDRMIKSMSKSNWYDFGWADIDPDLDYDLGLCGQF